MKKIVVFILIAALAISLCGCMTVGNRTIGIDTAQTFSWGIIQLGNGELIEGKVTSWRDFDDGDEVQVVIDNITYLTHYSNVILCSREP